MSDLKTPLYEWHVQNKAKMAGFAGWDMPIQYEEGILAEHFHTRQNASIFDICHMGQFIISGLDAKSLLAKAVTHNLDTLNIGKCRYGFLLTEEGTVIDDLIIYRLGDDEFFLVVNAACSENDFKILAERIGIENISDISTHGGKIDLQGPKSLEVLENVLNQSFKDLKYFSFIKVCYKDQNIIVSRTGYTGELGYELYCPRTFVTELWEDLMANPLVKPAGLGARDTLRLESGLSLYGHELDERHTLGESGLLNMLTSEADYVGKNLTKEVCKEILIPLKLEDRRAARNGDVVSLADGSNKIVGRVTSGSFAPSLGHSIAFAFVEKDYIECENFAIRVGRKDLMAQKTSLPFYKEGTARIKLA